MLPSRFVCVEIEPYGPAPPIECQMSAFKFWAKWFKGVDVEKIDRTFGFRSIPTTKHAITFWPIGDSFDFRLGHDAEIFIKFDGKDGTRREVTRSYRLRSDKSSKEAYAWALRSLITLSGMDSH